MLTEHTNLSRRTVTMAAAWGVPAVTVVAAAPPIAASPACDMGRATITRNLKYRVFVMLNGAPPVIVEDAPPYATPPGAMNQDIWDVVATTDLPCFVGLDQPLPAPFLSTQVTTSLAAADTLRIFGVTSVNGSATPTYTISGPVVGPGARTATLTIPDVSTPLPGQAIVTIASGHAQSEMTTSTPGTITQTIGKFTAIMNPTPSAPITTMGLAGALEPLGQDTSFGEIAVG